MLSLESYHVLVVCTYAPNCSFVDRTLWITRCGLNPPRGVGPGVEIGQFVGRSGQKMADDLG